MSKIVVFHDNCHDGVAAAWVCKRRFPDAELYAARYDVPPDLERLKGKDVIIVDFSWKRGPMLEIAAVASSVLVLDHHKTAEAELRDLNFDQHRDDVVLLWRFDMERSGAGLAWDWFFPNTSRPYFIDLVEDRDLWRFEFEETKAFHAGNSDLPLTYEARKDRYDDLCDNFEDEGLDALILKGEAILSYHNKLVDDLVSKRTWVRITPPEPHWPVECWAVCHPLMALVSDAGERLAGLEPSLLTKLGFSRPMGVSYWWEPGRKVWQFSLRSVGDFDVSEIAKVFGGGGHKNAAGFSVPSLEGVLRQIT